MSRTSRLSKHHLRALRERLWQRMRKTITPPREKKHYLVGVSGGSDSMALLHLLARGNWQITAVHINHHVRGKAADKDAELVKQTCKILELPCVIKNIHLTKTGKEADGRNKRYSAFTNLMRTRKACGVITAHHADDQAETFLMNLIRGAGIRGLGGMKSITALKTDAGLCTIFRPLLTTTKSELRIYCKNTGIQFHEDATNNDTTLTRNFIRHAVIPLLQKKNPQIVRRITTTQEIFQKMEKTAAVKDKTLLRKLRKTDPLKKTST